MLLRFYLYLDVFYIYFYKWYEKIVNKKKIQKRIKTKIEILLLLVINFFASFCIFASLFYLPKRFAGKLI